MILCSTSMRGICNILSFAVAGYCIYRNCNGERNYILQSNTKRQERKTLWHLINIYCLMCNTHWPWKTFLYTRTWVCASWIEFNNCPTRCDLFSLLHFCRQLYMFQVLTPIIRSWYSCNYSFWYWLTGSTTIRSRRWVPTQQQDRMVVDPVNQYQKL